MRETELLIYRNLEEEKTFHDMIWLMEHYADDSYKLEEKRTLLFECMHRLFAMAWEKGLFGNLWHCYLTNLLVNHENPYSLACEITGGTDGSVNNVALHDFSIIKEFYDFDFAEMIHVLRADGFKIALSYKGNEESKVYNRRIRDRICTLSSALGKAKSPQKMKERITEFYREYGVGKFGLHKAFRVEHGEDGVVIKPIQKIAHVQLDDLVGYEIPKRKLIENTEAFVEGRRANNCLLFGDAGTGKSSSIKAIANAYYEKGLRIIEMYKHQLRDLNDVIAQIKNRHYKFIIYMDDLSFEEFETEYKYLKAVIEGGLERKPENVLIYATSNRRHLIRENYQDKEGIREDMHTSDTVQEKLSLAYRFGVTIYFGSPDKKQFQEIVRVLAQRNGLDMPEEELLLEANKWELSHGGLSGRTAQQFIDYLLGTR